MRYLRQSTATVLEVGPFVDDGDGKTLEEALTVASIDVQLMQPLDTATIPADRVANGTFASDTAWTKNSWTISGGVANSASAQSTTLSQTPATGWVENVAYEVVFDVATQSAGSVLVSIGGTDGASRSTVATFTETLIAGSGALTEFKASSFTGTIDNVVIKQVPIPIVPAASGSTNDMVLTQSNTATYWLEITANQLGIVGRHKLTAFISGALIVWEEFMVLEEEVYDDLFAAGAVGYLKPSTAGRDLDVSSSGEAGIDWANVGSPTTTVGLSGTTVKTSTDIATDLDNATDGLGALKALLDAIPTTAMRGTDNASTHSVANVWDHLLTAITTASSIGKLLKDEITSARMAVLTDWINGGRLDLLLDAIPTTAMRGTDDAALASEVTAARMATLTDWINGGRLDLLLDAIKVPTDKMVFTKANELDVNTKSINDAEVIGDGNATPWDGA